MEDLFNLFKPYCKSFDLQYRNEKYKLILDEVKDFTGDTVEDVVIDAMDWIDDNEATNTNVDFKVFGYESDGRE